MAIQTSNGTDLIVTGDVRCSTLQCTGATGTGGILNASVSPSAGITAGKVHHEKTLTAMVCKVGTAAASVELPLCSIHGTNAELKAASASALVAQLSSGGCSIQVNRRRAGTELALLGTAIALAVGDAVGQVKSGIVKTDGSEDLLVGDSLSVDLTYTAGGTAAEGVQVTVVIWEYPQA